MRDRCDRAGCAAPEALETLDPGTIAMIRNFILPEASGGLSASHPLVPLAGLEARAFTADGFVISQASTTITAHSSLYDR